MSPDEIHLNDEQKQLLASVANSAHKRWPEVLREALDMYVRQRERTAQKAEAQMPVQRKECEDEQERIKLEEFHRKMYRKGLLLDDKPLPPVKGEREFQPVPIEGPPISQTIIEDRR